MGWVINATLRSLYPPGKVPVPIVQEAWWAPGPIWTVAEYLAPNGFRSLDLVARGDSVYRLNYPVPRPKC
jgi:hypothetical protein